MKICVVGAGAIGGLLGVRLAQAGHEVSLVARGAHLRAMQFNGLQLHSPQGEVFKVADVEATDDLRALEPQDLVILALKAHQIESVVDDLPSLLAAETLILTTQNGIPWWYFQRHGGPFEGYVLKTLDPTGRITAGIEPWRIIGCIAFPAAEIVRPGVIRHIEGDRFPVGELDGLVSDRVLAVSRALTDAGFKAPVLDHIRSEIWLKAWGNLSFNPISALTHATLVDICQNPDGRELAATMMTEAQAVAGYLGISFRVPLEKRIAGAERVGKHKTSMLQDVEAGKALETEALIGAVVELGELTGVPTPAIRAIYQAVRLLSHTITEEEVRVGAEPVARSGNGSPALRQIAGGNGS
ncbi:MAG TPA: 2-dehydropantoate 2-reductase [Gammaproteobacteria bacterium]|nr:2-dehydropantoate 2-reductase [Gammaproteobacteria bacterium]